jgi:hypothetical protein
MEVPTNLNDRHLDKPLYNTAMVARGAEVSQAKLLNWLARDFLHLAPKPEEAPQGLKSPGSGSRRMFSFRRALHVALTARLVEAGLAPRAASYAALRFTDFSSGAGGRARFGDDPADPVVAREPGWTWKGAGSSTLFVVWHGLEAEPDKPEARCVLFKEGMDLEKLFRRGSRFARSITVVDLDELDHEVRSRIGAPWDSAVSR